MVYNTWFRLVLAAFLNSNWLDEEHAMNKRWDGPLNLSMYMFYDGLRGPRVSSLTTNLGVADSNKSSWANKFYLIILFILQLIN